MGKIKIISKDTFDCSVELDGKNIEDICDLKIHITPDDVPVVMIKVLLNEIEFEADESKTVITDN